MPVPLTLTVAKISSISIPGLTDAIVGYVLGYFDGANVYHDVMVDNAPTTFTITRTPGDLILTPQALAELVWADAEARYGAAPDTVLVNEGMFQFAAFRVTMAPAAALTTVP